MGNTAFADELIDEINASEGAPEEGEEIDPNEMPQPVEPKEMPQPIEPEEMPQP